MGTEGKGLPSVRGRKGGSSSGCLPQQTACCAYLPLGLGAFDRTLHTDRTRPALPPAPSTDPFTLLRAAGEDPSRLSFQPTASWVATMLLDRA